MMSKKLSLNSQFSALLIISLGSIIMSSCDEIIEKDLSDEDLVVLTPPADFVSSSTTINFFWEEVEGSEWYKIQIAKPNFDTPEQILVDSSFNGNSASINLSAGNFEWKMRAENYNSFTPYVLGRIRVDSTSSLEGINPVLTTPVLGWTSNADSIVFAWEEVENATEYRFELNNITTSTVQSLELVTENEFSVFNITEGEYQWSIQAVNDFSLSNETHRNFQIDQTPPPSAGLVSPQTNSEVLVSSETTFKWLIQDDIGPTQTDRFFDLEISVNVDFDGLVFNTPIQTSIDSLNLSLDLPGTFFWRIRSSDSAGNDSIYSNTRIITSIE